MIFILMVYKIVFNAGNIQKNSLGCKTYSFGYYESKKSPLKRSFLFISVRN